MESGVIESLRPVHLRPGLLGLAVLGGAVGTTCREGVNLLISPVAHIPVATLAVNIAGAFLLGLLMTHLARRGTDAGRRRGARILLGTGLMGGFTTYSALASDVADLFGNVSAVSALGYGLATVIIGAAASWAGIALGGLQWGSASVGADIACEATE